MKDKIEPIIEDEDLSSSDYETYIPQIDVQDLEVDESAYETLEYVSLEWPSQTIQCVENEVLLCTNPVDYKSQLVILNFERTDNFKNMKNFDFERIEVPFSYNRMRMGKSDFVCVSDNNLSIFNSKLKLFYGKEGDFSYGISFVDSKVAVGTKKGEIVFIDYNKKSESVSNLHQSSIESIDYHDNLLFTASCDKSMKVKDLRSNETVLEHKCDTEVNSVSFNKHNHVLFGDDEGNLYLRDIRNNENEVINWHKTPISFTIWKDEDVFVSCSDEQVVIWDKSFDEEWEYHKYISFVHQGQKLYKEVCLFKDYFITTSFEGVCIFKPIEDEF